MSKSILELSMARLEKNKDRKEVREIGGKVLTLAGVNQDEGKIRLIIRVSGDTVHMEDRKYKGHLFYCQICEKYRGFNKLSHSNYRMKPVRVVCIDCIDHITYEEAQLQ
jgi:hypothetical protein